MEPYRGVRQGFTSHPPSFYSRQYEIDRFRKWYIDRFYGRPPEGFSWSYRPNVDYEDVNHAVNRFLSHGFRYPSYPYSN